MNRSEFVKKRRCELGLTMLDVAKAVDVSEATVSRWESGHIFDMRVGRITPLAEILHVSPLELLQMESIRKERS